MTVSRIDGMICRQEGLPSLTRERIQEVQLQKLNRLLKREKDRQGFYSGLPEHLDSLSDLSSLPFTMPQDLREHGAGILLVSQSAVQRVITDETSGTTGNSKRVFYTEQDCEQTISLFMAGLGELIFPGSITMVCMPFSGPYGLGELIAEAICRLGATPLKIGIGKTYGELQTILETEKPDTYVGMTVPLLSLLRYCGKGSLQRALVSGDTCPETVIAECERILGTKLFPHYGSREMGLAGAICCPAHEGMHLRENHTIAEIIDERGNPVPDGEFGELVITTIGAEAMPLIRYRTGDRTRILPEPCRCGSCVLRLDYLVRTNGTDMEMMDNSFFSLPWLIDWEAVSDANRMKIQVLTDGSISQSEAETVLGRNAEVSVQTVNDNCRPFYPGKRVIRHLSF